MGFSGLATRGCTTPARAGTGHRCQPSAPPTPAESGETSSDDDAWAARWTHQFTDWLQTAVEGPLHAGRWTLARGMPSWSVPAHWDRLHAANHDQGHITWFGYGAPDEDIRDVLPLRRLSPVDAGRVKAYRRELREGVLPLPCCGG